MKHPKWIRVISSFIAVLLLVSTFSQTVFAVEGDGTHIGHTGGGSSVSGAYLVPSSNDDHLVGYRFSWLTLGSDGYYARKSALDVFYNGYNPNSSWGYHIKAIVNGTTYRNLSKYEYKRWFDSVKIEREYYSTSSAYKYCNRTDIPVVLPADEDAMTTWGLQDGNINKILNKMQSGATVANMKSSDFVFIEPIYRVKIEGTNYCITVTEMGLIGCVVCSKTSTGNEGSGYGSGWVTIRRYTNLNWPDALKTDSAHAGISAGTTLSSATSFQNLVNKGYGLMVIWNRNPHLLSVYYTTGTGDSSLKISSSYKLASDFTSYSSSYIRNSSNNYFTQSVYYDNNLTLMNGAGSGFKMTRDYYDFFKWKKDGTSQLFSGGTAYKASSLESTVSTGDRSITLTAVWTPKPYKITYNLNGGKIGSSTTNPTQNYNYETDVYIGNYSSRATAYATPIRDGYDFGGWKYTGTTLGYWSNNSVYPNKYHKGQWEHGDITLYAQWVKKTYTVTYNANGGTGAPASQTKTHGVDLTLASGKPTRDGYNFVSWNTKADGKGTTYQPGAKYTTNANLTLYAQWVKKTYTVTYNANGGSGAPASQTKTHGVDLTLSSGIPTRTGYDFVSWNTKADGSGATFKPSAKYTSNANLVLYAQWKLKTYTVSYNANGGSGAPASQTKTHGVDLTLTSGKPTRDGYNFVSWNTKADGKGTTYQPSVKYTANANLTLYAQWAKKTYTVSYNANGGSGAPASQTKTHGVDLTLASGLPTRTGYDFMSWNTKADGKGTTYKPSAKYTANANLTLYAQWAKKTYTVTYNANGGSGAPASQTKTHGVDLSLASGKPTRDGYNFVSWNTKADGKGTTYQPGAKYTTNANLTLYAQWVKKIYTVTYNANGGSGAPASQTKTHGVDLTLASGKPTRDGYNFISWNTKADGKGTTYQPSAKYTTNANLTLYAQWAKKTYTVTYNANGGSGAPASQTKTHGVDLTLASGIPTRTGHDFVSWNTKADGKGTTYKPGAKYTANADLTLYAQWKLKTYTISYNANGGSGAPVSQTKTHNVDLTLASGLPTRTGFDFVSWNTKADGKGTTYKPGAKYTSNANLVLYAQWKLKTYIVSYNANGGSGAPASQTKTHGVDLSLASGKPTRDGYSFISWNTKVDGKGTTYLPSAKYTANANLTLYAQWAKKTYTVTYNANGGSGAPASQTKTHGVDLTLASGIPTRTGYDFLSWNTKADGKGTTYKPSAKYEVNADLTLYAQWKLKTYTVTYDANGGKSAPAAQIKNHGVDLTLASGKPTRDGYDFVSWNTKADGKGTTYHPSGKYAANANLTLYAQWKLKSYTVTYNANGGSGAPASQTKTHGVDLTLASGIPTRTGYDFVLWNTKADGSGTTFKPSAKYTSNANLVLYAQWKLKTYTVSYNANGGSGAPASQTKTHGVDLTLASGKPTRDGYNFVSWNTKADGKGTTYQPSTKYTSNANLTLYAQWAKKTYTVTYNANGGSGAPASQTKTHGVDLTLASGLPTRTGYDFMSWNTKADGKGTTYKPSAKYTANANLTLYAQWAKRTYTVTYNANGGSGAPASQTKTHGVDLTLSSGIPTRTGYDFLSWNTKADGSGATFKPSAKYTSNANLVLYAQWKLKIYTVSYNANGGSGAPASQLKTHGVDLTLASGLPTRTGYDFMSWNTKADGKGTTYKPSAKYTANADLTLYAQWKLKTYTITYDANGGKSAPAAQIKKHGVDLTLASGKPTRDGYDFVSWNTKADGKGTTYQPSGKYATDANLTLYAQWKLQSYTVTYNANGGTGAPGAQTKTYNVDLMLSSVKPTRTGYGFVGWNTNANGSGTSYAVGARYTKNENLTLYAQWQLNAYTVSYNANGGKGAPADQTKKHGTDLTLSATKPTREGYSFVSWNTKSDGKGTAYSSGGKYTGNADLQLFAIWNPIQYTVKFIGNGATGGTMSNQTHTYDRELALTANAYKREFIVTCNYGNGSANTTAKATAAFGGWAKTATGTKAYDNQQKVKNLTAKNGEVISLYAKWTDGSVTLPTPTRTGYIFGGWYTSASSGTKIGDGGARYTPSKDITVYARWTPITYTVRYNGNGATTGKMSNQTHTYDKELALTSNAFKREFTVTFNFNGNGSSNSSSKASAAFGGWAKTAAGAKAYDNQQKVKNLTSKSGDVIDLYAKWTDGSVTLPTPSRTGYVLTGWYTAASGGTRIGDGGAKYTPGANITLYAQWSPIIYTVRFNGNGSTGGSMKDQGFTYDKEQSLTANAFRRDFTVTYNYGNGSANTSAVASATFGGWAKTATGSKVYDNQQKVKNLSSKNGDLINLYAKWTDASVTLPTPTRTGYTFNGWYIAASSGTKIGAAGAKYTPSKDITLFAQWMPIKYSVKYNGNGSTSGTMSNQSFTYDVEQALTANAFKRVFTVTYNYGNGASNSSEKATAVFGGWAKTASGAKEYNNQQKVKNLSAKSGDVVNLYALWTDAALTLPSPTKTGYHLTGWFTSSSGGTKVGDGGGKYTPAKDVTLYAQWTPVTYTVRFNGNGATSGTMADQSFTYDKSQNLTANAYKRTFTVTFAYGNGAVNTTAKATSAFGGWAKTATGAKAYGDQQSVKNLTAIQGDVINLYARWSDASVPLPNPTRTGYTFSGWYTDTTGGTKIGEGGGSFTPSGNITVYGRWTPISYTVVFNGNGSTGGSTASMSVKYDETKALTANGFTRTGYQFASWNTKADGSGFKYTDKQQIKNLTAAAGAKVTLYAQWMPISYTVLFNGNGSTGGATATMTVKYDESKALTANGFTRTGYQFVSWNTKVDGTGTPYSDKQTIRNLSAVNGAKITLYAVWQPAYSLSLEMIQPNAAYREGTDVVSSFYLVNQGGSGVTPAEDISVIFKVYRGSTVIKTVTLSKVVVPANEKNLLYFKWSVPSSLGSDKLYVSAEISEAGESYGLIKNMYASCKYEVSATPDTQFEISAPEGYTVPAAPSSNNTAKRWTEWVYENGAFKQVTYGIGISDAAVSVVPDASANAEKKNGVWTMKSGYSVSLSVDNGTKTVSGCSAPASSSYTKAQYAAALFPEFGYLKTNGNYRTLELVSGKWQFRQNADYGRLHFTPLWFPDGPYTAAVVISDLWTPAGMLTRTANANTIIIDGSAYDDWSIG